MYQVKINDYYVSELDGVVMYTCKGLSYFDDVTLTRNKYNAKFFEYKEEAKHVADLLNGEVIEYIEKKGINIEIKSDINVDNIDVVRAINKFEQCVGGKEVK